MARILVIDDDESLLQMMSLMLKRGGHEPILASNGHDGIELARKEHPDMAIVDVMMPEISGYEVCRTLRQDPATMDIPLMILTALSGTDYDDEAVRAGADNYLTKPVTRSDLQNNVQRLLETGAVNTPVEDTEPETLTAISDEQVEDELNQVTAAFSQPPQVPTTASPHLIAVVGATNSVGATTLAINLALGAMQFGRSCIVDLHANGGQSALHLGMKPQTSWEPLINVAENVDKHAIGSSLTIHKSGVAVLPSPDQPTDAVLSAEALSVIYDVLGEGFKRVIVDLPDLNSPMSLATIQQAAHIVVVVGENPAVLQNAAHAINMLEEMGLAGTIHIVINRTRPHGLSHEDITQTLQRPVSSDIPYEPEQINAMMQGSPLLMAQPNSLFSRAILYLARQL